MPDWKPSLLLVGLSVLPPHGGAPSRLWSDHEQPHWMGLNGSPFGVFIGLARRGQSAAGGHEGIAHLGDTMRLVVVAFDRRKPASGTVRVTIPGFTLVRGDTILELGSMGDGPTTLLVRPIHSGSFELGARLDITREGEVDEYESVLRVTVKQDTILIGENKIVRVEAVVDGQRYRCWGQFAIPVDGPERVVEWQVVKPIAIECATASCRECSFAGIDTVSLVVIVDKQGHVIDARPLPIGRTAWSIADSPETAAARRALQDWKFKPATFEGRPVNDWQCVRVPVFKEE